MSVVEAFDPNEIRLSDNAVSKVRALVEVERDGVTALIDAMSYQYLVGSEVDYSEGLEGSRFVVNNPNATTTCGCGASFSI